MYVIFEVLNKQFIAEKNKIIYVDKLNYKVDSNIKFDKILLVNNNNILTFGNPYIKNIKIIAVIIKHFKCKKINIIKFKRRKHHIKNYNHRQLVTKIKILDII